MSDNDRETTHPFGLPHPADEPRDPTDPTLPGTAPATERSEPTEEEPAEVARARTAETDHPNTSDEVDRSVIISDSLRVLAQQCLRILIIVVTIYVLWLAIRQFWQGVLPVLLAIIVSTVLATPTQWLRRRKIPGGIAALISLLTFFAVFGWLIAAIVPDIVRQSQVLYLQAFEGVQRLQLWLQGPPFELDTDDLNEVVNEIAAWLQTRVGSIVGGVFSGLTTVGARVVTLFIVLVLTFFFLKDGHNFLPWLRSVMGRRQGWHATELLTRSWHTLGGYIRAQAIVSLIDAVFIGIGLAIIDVPMTLALAVITFLAGFIPIVGAISAGALAVIIALISLGMPQAIATLVLIIAVQQLEGNILSPLLQSRAMHLHPVIVLVSVTVGGSLFGITGAFLAVPVAAMIAVLFRYLQDITMLRSGEKTPEEVAFTTKAGAAIGEFSYEEGKQLRERMHQEVFLAPDDNPDGPFTPNLSPTMAQPGAAPVGVRREPGARGRDATRKIATKIATVFERRAGRR